MVAFLRTLVFSLIATFIIVLMVEILGLRKAFTGTEPEATNDEYIIRADNDEGIVNRAPSEKITELKDALNENQYSPALSQSSVPTKNPAASLNSAMTENTLFYDSFESAPETTGWQTTGLGPDSTAKWSQEQVLSGHYALKISAGQPSNNGWPGWVNTLELQKHSNYLLQVSYYTPDGANAWLEQSFLDQSGRLITGFSTGCPRRSSLKQWTAIKHRVKASSIPPNSRYLRLGLRQCLNHTKGTLTHLFFDDISLTTEP